MRKSTALLAIARPFVPVSTYDRMYAALNVETPSHIDMLAGTTGAAGIQWADNEVIPGLVSPTFVRANNSFVYIDPSELVFGADNMTCLLFFKCTNPVQELFLFSVRRPTTPPNGMHSMSLDGGDNNCKFFWYHDGTIFSSGVNLRDGNMHMVAMVKDASFCRAYVDGVPNGTPVARSASTAYGGVAGAIGNLGALGSTYGLDGSESAFAYYRQTALTPERIAEIWAAANV